MKSYRRSYLAQLDARIDQQKAQQAFLAKQAQANKAPAVAKPKLNRAQRRRNELFNRKLANQLEKQGTPAQVRVLEDGGLHVTLSKEELEMRHAEEDGEVSQEPEGENHPE